MLPQDGVLFCCRLGSTYEGLKRNSPRSSFSRHPRLGSTYEGLKRSPWLRIGQSVRRLGSTYEGLKHTSFHQHLGAAEDRLGSTYEGLKPFRCEAARRTSGSVWALPMRD